MSQPRVGSGSTDIGYEAYVSIDNIWAQTVSDEFLEHLHETINENSDRLGNLALMTIEDNVGNQIDPLEKKKAAFDEFKFRMLNKILENDDWFVERIEDREQPVFDVIRTRWPDTIAEKTESTISAA